MPNILEKAREKYGSNVAHMDDGQLLGFLHSRMAPDEPIEQFARKNGVSQGFLSGLARTAVQGATLGLSDELRGVGAALLPGGDDYATARDKERGALSGFREDHPVLSFAAELAGGIPTGMGVARGLGLGAKAATSVGRQALTAGRVAATEGAVYGAGSADGDARSRLTGAVAGGVAGGTLGALLPLAAVGTRKAATLARDVVGGSSPQTAQRLMDDSLIDAVRGGSPKVFEGVDDATALGRLAREAQERSGRGGMLVDRSPTMQRAGRSAFAVNNPANEGVEGTLRNRLGAADERSGEVLRRYTGTDAVEKEMFLDAKRAELRGRARPLYERAYAVGEVDDPVINDLMGRLQNNRAASRAWDEALELASDEGVMLTRNVRVTPEGGIVFDTTPTVQTLDYLKRGLDGVIDQGYRGTTPGLSSARARSLNENIRKPLLERLDDIVPEYGAARNVYKGDLDAIRAFEGGVDAFRKDVSEIRKTLAEMGPDEAELFRTGFVTRLRERMADAQMSAENFLTKSRHLNRIRAVFGEDGFEEFARMLRELENQALSKNTVLDGSRTAALMNDMGAAPGAGELTIGGYVGAGQVGAGIRTLLQLASRRPGIQRANAAALNRRLYLPETEALTDLAARAQQRSGENVVRNQLMRRRGVAGGLLGGYAGGLYGRGR